MRNQRTRSKRDSGGGCKRGEYRVKSPGLQPLYEQARALVRRIGAVTFEHVRREFNKDADRLANEAMDEAAAG